MLVYLLIHGEADIRFYNNGVWLAPELPGSAPQDDLFGYQDTVFSDLRTSEEKVMMAADDVQHLRRACCLLDTAKAGKL